MSNEIKGLRAVPVTEKRQLFQHYQDQDSALRRKHKPPYSDLRFPELNQIGNIRQIQLWPNSYVPEDANFGCAELVFGFFKHEPWMRSLFFLGSPVNLFVDPINFLGERGYAVVEGEPHDGDVIAYGRVSQTATAQEFIAYHWAVFVGTEIIQKNGLESVYIGDPDIILPEFSLGLGSEVADKAIIFRKIDNQGSKE